MDDLERQVIDAILDGDPGETVMETPGDKWVSLKHIYPRIAAALRATVLACYDEVLAQGHQGDFERVYQVFLAALKGGDDG